MTTTRVIGFFWVSFLAVGIAFIGGCARKSPQVLLGPKPAMYASERDAWENQAVDNMRLWLETLSPQDAATLLQNGEVSFSYETLKASDPAHASMVENHVSQMRARIEEGAKAKGLLPPILTPEKITFLRAVHDAQGKAIQGAYELVIEFADGSFSNLPLSEPL